MLNRSEVEGTYTVCSIEITKPGLYADADDVVEAILRRIEEHPKARLIAVFDHLEHTWEVGGDIAPEVVAARHVVFCLGLTLPGPVAMALRPRAIAVTELNDRFIVNFLETPVADAGEIVARWVASLAEER
jgi:hypothetical protein